MSKPETTVDAAPAGSGKAPENKNPELASDEPPISTRVIGRQIVEGDVTLLVCEMQKTDEKTLTVFAARAHNVLSKRKLVDPMQLCVYMFIVGGTRTVSDHIFTQSKEKGERLSRLVALPEETNRMAHTLIRNAEGKELRTIIFEMDAAGMWSVTTMVQKKSMLNLLPLIPVRA